MYFIPYRVYLLPNQFGLTHTFSIYGPGVAQNKLKTYYFMFTWHSHLD